MESESLDARQTDLIVSDFDEPRITVDDLETAQFIYLLLDHKRLRSVLNTVTNKGVLLLGRFGGGGLEVLTSVADRVRSAGYLPMIFDFQRPKNQDYTETVQTLAGLSHFVIADLSGPSVPQELQACVPVVKVPYIGIIENGRTVYSTFKVLFQYPWVARPVVGFADLQDLIQKVPSEIIDRAEKLSRRRAEILEELFGGA